MARITVSVDIGAPVDRVWSILERVDGHVDWMHDAEAIRFETDQHDGVGTRFVCDTKVGPLRLADRMEITEWSESAAMGVRHDGVVTGTGRFTLTPIDLARRTRFEWSEDLHFPWFLGGPVGELLGGKVVMPRSGGATSATSRPSLRQRHDDRRADVVVIGKGAMGSATAWHLARRGRSVVLAEQFGPGHRNGSSHGGVRIFRHAYSDPHYVTLAARALPWWREAESDTGEELLELTGAYDHGPEEALRPIADALSRHGIVHELLSADAAHVHVPGLMFDTGALYHPIAGRCFADRTVAALQRRVGELGGDVRYDVRARLRIVDDHVEVDVGDRVIRASSAVVTAGAWVEPVLTAAGLSTPRVKVTQEQVPHFPPLDPNAAWPSFIHHRSPWRYGLHTPGEGVKVGGHHEGAVTSADDRTHDLDDDKLRSIVEYVRRWVPGVEPTPQFGATCLYTTTANEDFVLDRVGPVVIGSPCSGHGFKFAPLIGAMLADLATGVSVEQVVDARHRLDRFA